jgi:Domain of unknown function (DUF4157)
MHQHEELDLAEVRSRAAAREETAPDRDTQRALALGRTERLGPQQISSLQRAAGNRGVTGLVEDDAGESVRSALTGGGGRPLDDDTRTSMEAQLGSDFSSVRVHTGTAAQRSTEAVAARAYTVGDDIVFSDGVYDTGSDSGQRTLAHELTHVVQQREGPVDGTETAGGVKVSDPGDRFEREAESTADAVMAGNGPGLQAQRDAPSTAGGATIPTQRESPEEEELQMQRHADPDADHDLQMQREEEPEEEEMQMQREEEPEEEEMQMQREEDPEEEEMQMQRESPEEEEMQMERERR